MKVILRNLNPTRRIFFNAQVNIKETGESFIITQDWLTYQAKKEKPDQPMWRVRFDENRTSFFIEYKEEGEKGETETDRKKRKAIAMLAKHENVMTLFGERNVNLRGEAAFSLEFEGHKNTAIADTNDKKFEVYKKFRPMTPNEKRDCAFYYGCPDAANKKHSELIVAMADFNSGILMNQTPRKNETIAPIDHFLTKYGSEHISMRKMITEKALVYQLITKDEKGFWFQQDYIGATQENIYSYLESHPQIQSQLLTAATERDKKVEDDMGKEEPVIEQPLKFQNYDLLKKMRDYGRELGVKSAGTCGVGTLEEAIKKIAQKEGVDTKLPIDEMVEKIKEAKLQLV